jgi:hypothetical protein
MSSHALPTKHVLALSALIGLAWAVGSPPAYG